MASTVGPTYVCFPMAFVLSILFPWAFGLGAPSTKGNQLDYYLKANIWLGILSYVGSFTGPTIFTTFLVLGTHLIGHQRIV